MPALDAGAPQLCGTDTLLRLPIPKGSGNTQVCFLENVLNEFHSFIFGLTTIDGLMKKKEPVGQETKEDHSSFIIFIIYLNLLLFGLKPQYSFTYTYIYIYMYIYIYLSLYIYI